MDAFVDNVAANLQINNRFDPALYGEFNVKRGLRNANGTGVVVGLTQIGDVVGHDKDENGEKIAIPGKLYYRGIDVEDIVNNCLKEDRFGYEETAYLLLFGELPNKTQLSDFEKLLGITRELPGGFTRDMILVAPSKSVMNKMARSVLSLYSYDDNPDDLSVKNVLRQSIKLIAYCPSLIAYGYQAKRSYYDNDSLHLHYPDPERSTAENILRMIRPTSEYLPLEAKILDLCLILHAEHGGGNNSSFTTHVVTSTGTDTYSAIAAAIGSLKGPKHGGANLQVMSMVEDIKANVKDITNEREVEYYLQKILEGDAHDHSGLIYGMGHAVYTISDPRTTLLKKMARQLAEEQGLLEEFQLYDTIERLGPDMFREFKGIDKPMCANVDLYSGFVYSALNIPKELITPLFATGRMAGWCAHRLEELVAGGKIIRPAYKCVQPLLPYIPLEDRR
ncbi:MAG: citrate/2-methylcitrate synthase [Clostridiales bacterium]|nr:citrate/2-methylcitrate synthase [Clostridiales bacterium]